MDTGDVGRLEQEAGKGGPACLLGFTLFVFGVANEFVCNTGHQGLGSALVAGRV